MTNEELQDNITLLDNIINKLTLCNKKFINFECSKCGRWYSIPLRCNLILCESCGSYRFKKLKTKYLPVLNQYQNIKLLTLTWKKETIDKFEIRTRHRKVRRLIKKYFEGGIYTFEGLAQHVHCLVVGRYIPTRLISKTWRTMTKSSFVVDIRKASPQGLNYVLKYVCKPPTYSESEFETYYNFWYHNRRVSTVGVFYKVSSKVKFQLKCSLCCIPLTPLCLISDVPYDYPKIDEIFINGFYP